MLFHSLRKNCRFYFKIHPTLFCFLIFISPLPKNTTLSYKRHFSRSDPFSFPRLVYNASVSILLRPFPVSFSVSFAEISPLPVNACSPSANTSIKILTPYLTFLFPTPLFPVFPCFTLPYLPRLFLLCCYLAFPCPFPALLWLAFPPLHSLPCLFHPCRIVLHRVEPQFFVPLSPPHFSFPIATGQCDVIKICSFLECENSTVYAEKTLFFYVFLRSPFIRFKYIF